MNKAYVAGFLFCLASTCIVAEGYGPGYHDPLYIYVLDP